MSTAAAPALGFESRCGAATCRSCGHGGLVAVFDLGPMPLSDALVAAGETRPEPRHPLGLAWCGECTLLQILETLPPETLFGADYPYYSSFSDSFTEHARRSAAELIARRGLGAESRVVELASNDGYLLRHFAERGVPVLGIDPAPGPARAAREAGVPTLEAFFDEKLAARMAAEGARADLVLANNVLAHVADLHGFVAGVRRLLKDDGLAVIEVPYVRRLVERAEFDTIYHEHLCYFSVTSLARLFRRHGLRIAGVRELPVHGGSLRVDLTRGEGESAGESPSVAALLEEEARAGRGDAVFYLALAGRARRITRELRLALERLRREGRSLAAYGAAAKGAVFLNFAGITAELIDFAVDRNPHKQGKLMPGVRIPILAPETLLERMPDYTVILPWNLVDEIVGQQQEYRRRGGRFVVAIPELRVI